MPSLPAVRAQFSDVEVVILGPASPDHHSPSGVPLHWAGSKAWPKEAQTNRIMTTPAVGDFNGDGTPDLLVGSNERLGEGGQPSEHTAGVRAPVDIVPQQHGGEGLACVPGLLANMEQGLQRRLQQVEATMHIADGTNDRARRHLGVCHVGGLCHAGDV